MSLLLKKSKKDLKFNVLIIGHGYVGSAVASIFNDDEKTIIDPRYDDDDNRLITTIFNPYEGAEYLKYKREQWLNNQKG